MVVIASVNTASQCGCQCVGEGAEVFREEWKGKGVREHRVTIHYVRTVVKLTM